MGFQVSNLEIRVAEAHERRGRAWGADTTACKLPNNPKISIQLVVQLLYSTIRYNCRPMSEVGVRWVWDCRCSRRQGPLRLERPLLWLCNKLERDSWPIASQTRFATHGVVPPLQNSRQKALNQLHPTNRELHSYGHIEVPA